MSERDFLKEVYELRSADDVKKHYDEWSESYDDSVCGNGYIVPERCAKALADIADDKSEPMLDFGCGTGISGDQLAKEGFSAIDGCDISKRMLEVAERKGIYRKLWQIDADENLPFRSGQYRHIAAVGVISVGAAPISTLDTLMNLLPSGGTLTFSYNDHTLQDAEYQARVSEFVDTGSARLLFKEYGDHLPGIGIKAMVHVLEKA